MTTIDILKKTRATRGGLAVLDEAGKNALLLSMADSLLSHEGAILAENEADMSDARGHISDVMLDRLRLDHDRLAGMADGVRAIAALPDHTGVEHWELKLLLFPLHKESQSAHVFLL